MPQMSPMNWMMTSMIFIFMYSMLKSIFNMNIMTKQAKITKKMIYPNSMKW